MLAIGIDADAQRVMATHGLPQRVCIDSADRGPRNVSEKHWL